LSSGGSGKTGAGRSSVELIVKSFEDGRSPELVYKIEYGTGDPVVLHENIKF
jgi:hypothetical protein